MIAEIERKMVYQLAFMQAQINYYVDCDGNIGGEIINESSLWEDAKDCGKLLKEVSTIDEDHATMVKEEIAKARKEAHLDDNEDVFDDE